MISKGLYPSDDFCQRPPILVDSKKRLTYTETVLESIRSSFTEATRLVLEEIGFTATQINPVSGKAAETIDLIASIGLVGQLKGYFILRFGTPSATEFVKTLSGSLGMDDADHSDPHFRKAAISEIANQFGGKAIALLSEKGMDCMITPPTVITGNGVDASLPESDDMFEFAIVDSFGSFRCVVALKGSKPI